MSAASGGNSEPKQGQRSQSARGFCPRSTMRVPQPDIIEHFGNADAVPQPPERCLSRQAGIVRCCLKNSRIYCILGPRLIFIAFLRVCFSFLNLPARLAGTKQRRVFVESHRANTACGNTVEVPARPTPWIRNLWQHRTIPALRLKHRSGSCGTASALPKCSIRHPVLSALLAWHLPHLARRIGT